MTHDDADDILKTGGEIASGFKDVLTKHLGPNFLVGDDYDKFVKEVGSIGVALNHLNSVVASFVIQRMVEGGVSSEEAYEIIKRTMQEDAAEMAALGRDRFNEGVEKAKAIFKKRSTTH